MHMQEIFTLGKLTFPIPLKDFHIPSMCNESHKPFEGVQSNNNRLHDIFEHSVVSATRQGKVPM